MPTTVRCLSATAVARAFMNGPVLITGASGYLGGHLAASLGREGSGAGVIALHGSRPLAPEVVRSAAATRAIDLTDGAAVREAVARFAPRTVIHAAALADAKRCELDPDAARLANVEGTRNLLDALPAETLFIHVSTDLVFDGCEAPPGGLAESHEPAPQSVYARTKRTAEELVLARNVDAAPNSFVVRSALIYGPPIGAQQGVLGWMRGALDSRTPLTLFTDELRTPIFVGDLLAIFREIARPRAAALPPLLHAGGPERCSRYRFGELLARALGVEDPLLQPLLRAELPLVPPRPRDVSLCSSLAYSRCGIAPTGLELGLERSVAPRAWCGT